MVCIYQLYQQTAELRLDPRNSAYIEDNLRQLQALLQALGDTDSIPI